MTGILCLFYYVGIVLYAGFSTSFSKVWLFGGAALLLLRSALRYQTLHPHLWLRVLTGSALALLAAALAAILVIGSRIVGAMRAVPQTDLDYVIVLGAQVRGTRPSLSLKRRLERAAEYAEDNPDTLLILSGGQGPDEGISEAECMYRYLVRAGVPEDRLIRENASTSTRENLIFSAEVICGLGVDGENPMPGAVPDTGSPAADSGRNVSNLPTAITSPVGILSNDFHIYRALLLARQTGFRNASGIPAKSVPGMQPHNILREICAVLKQGVLHLCGI